MSVSVYQSVCMSRWWITGKRFQINPPFSHKKQPKDVFGLVVVDDLDLLSECQIFESKPSHSGKRPCKCDECECCCTQSSHLVRYKLTHSSKRSFKCDECEFKCDICSKTNRHLTRHKRARHIKVVFPDSVTFV